MTKRGESPPSPRSPGGRDVWGWLASGLENTTDPGPPRAWRRNRLDTAGRVLDQSGRRTSRRSPTGKALKKGEKRRMGVPRVTMIGRAAFATSLMTVTGTVAAMAVVLGSLSLGPLHRTANNPAAPVVPAEPLLTAFAPFSGSLLPEAVPEAPAVGYMSYDYAHRLQPGETLGGVLTEAGIAAGQARAAIEAMRQQFDPRRMRAGQEVEITVGLPGAAGSAPEIQKIAFDVEFPHRIVVVRGPDGAFEAFKDERRFQHAAAEAAGTIRSSLFQAGSEAKVPPAVLARLMKVFSWDVDFQRDIRRGDRFAVIYDRLVDRDGAAVKSGDIAAAAVDIGGKRVMLYRFVAEDGTADYYTADGQSARKPLLRTPVDGARLSSGYGKRRHPILGYTRMHRGVDFAAPTGTPILASGDGTVEFVGRRGGYGKYMRLRHRSGYSTAYAHMSRYAKGMHAGRRVKQGQVIGYVGSTGRSTGPHLHYEVLVNGKHINPMSVRTLPGRALAGKDVERFRALAADFEARLVALLDDAAPTVVARAGE